SLYQAALKTLNLYLDRLIAADKVNEALGVLATAKKLGLPATLPQAELIRLSLTTGSELVLPRLNLERPHTYCPVRLTER
ncbi:MAG TPA: hypothetical protein VHQ46_05780, partial [Desulfobacteria bacterium]|nr:hypothetical protein [Desulfobacteria bacterium]